jgi:hypothetical protein
MPTDFDTSMTDVDIRSQSMIEIIDPWAAAISEDTQERYCHLAQPSSDGDLQSLSKISEYVDGFFKYIHSKLKDIPQKFKRDMMRDKNFNSSVKQRSYFVFPEQEKTIKTYALYLSQYVAYLIRRCMLEDEIADQVLPKLVNDDEQVSDCISYLENVDLESDAIDFLPLLRLLKIHLLLDVKMTTPDFHTSVYQFMILSNAEQVNRTGCLGPLSSRMAMIKFLIRVTIVGVLLLLPYDCDRQNTSLVEYALEGQRNTPFYIIAQEHGRLTYGIRNLEKVPEILWQANQQNGLVDHQRLQMNGLVVSLHDIKTLAKNVILKAETESNFFAAEFGFAYDQLIDFEGLNVLESMSCTTPGFAFFTQNELQRIQHILAKKILKKANVLDQVDREANVLYLKEDWRRKILSLIADHNLTLVILSYIGAGQPPRITELLCSLLRNQNGAVLRNVFLLDGQVVLRQCYVKTRSSTQTEKSIYRFLPQSCSHLWIKFLVVLQPLRAFLLGCGRDWPPEKCVYPNIILAGPTGDKVLPETVGKKFGTLCKALIGKNIHSREWRQIIIAYSEKHIKSYGSQDPYDIFVALQAGHSFGTSQTHYAISANIPNDCGRAEFEAFRKISSDYHRMIGLNTEFQQPLQMPIEENTPIRSSSSTSTSPSVTRIQIEHLEKPKIIKQACFEADYITDAQYFETATSVAKEFLPNFQEFKSTEQHQAVALVLSNLKCDALINLKTGGGKSMVYETYAKADARNVAVVIVPLSSLYEDTYSRLTVSVESLNIYRNRLVGS